MEALVVVEPDFINKKVQELLGKPEAEPYICQIFDFAILYESYKSQKIEDMNLYNFIKTQPGGTYYYRMIDELNKKFNIL